MAAIPKEQVALLRDVFADPIAKRMLQDKCRWERMSLHGVLLEWGDPRRWKQYEAEKARAAGSYHPES